MFRSRTVFASFLTAAALAGATGEAAATNATLSPSGGYTASSRGVRMSAGIINITCDVLLSGDLSPSIATSAGNLVGTVTSGAANNCVGGTASVDATTPWTLTATSFLGTLPNFTGVLFNISTVRFTVVVAGQTCNYAGTIGALAPNNNGANRNGSISVINMLANSLARQAGSSALCPASGSLSTPQQFTLDQLRTVVIS